jgi:geranylgeranyl reductase family protein
VLSADVAVVGAGPAGSAAAIVLARAGRRVVLIDKARFPRDKCCGDGLTTAALRRLDGLGLRPGDVASWQPIDGVVIRAPDGRQATFPLPTEGTYAAAARRVDLDAALVALAADAGVRVIEGCAVTGAGNDLSPGTVQLDTSAERVSARYVIAADGMWSPMRKAFDARDEPGYLGDWHAIRQYFTGVGPEAAKMWVWFEPDLIPGYAWSFPLPGGRANVGFGIHRSAGRTTGQMGHQWADLLARSHLAAVLGPAAHPEGPSKAWPIPARVGRSPLSAAGGRVLFVGDAARATDSMTGEGIGQALETAEMASLAILAAGPHAPQRAAAGYGRTIGRSLVVDDRLCRVLSRLLGRPNPRWMGPLASSDWTRRNFARWMFEDYPRALMATPRRWRWGALHAPPPYPAGAGTAS